jgi:hypothetical protein
MVFEFWARSSFPAVSVTWNDAKNRPDTGTESARAFGASVADFGSDRGHRRVLKPDNECRSSTTLPTPPCVWLDRDSP